MTIIACKFCLEDAIGACKFCGSSEKVQINLDNGHITDAPELLTAERAKGE
jgi:hypothetical protein